MVKTAELVAKWDQEYEATLPRDAPMDVRRPYNRAFDALQSTYHVRFQPYQNDLVRSYTEKLRVWLSQFREEDRKFVFLLACKVVFVSQQQLEALQRRLFSCVIHPLLVQAAATRSGASLWRHHEFAAQVPAEMDKTMFIPLSDSSALNSFVHVNVAHFENREQRALVGPEYRFWCYPSLRGRDPNLSSGARRTATQFEAAVLATDRRLLGKERLIVLEDFSGSGDDVASAMTALAGTALPVEEIVFAPLIATERASRRLRRLAIRLSQPSGRYRLSFQSALTVPRSMTCFGTGTSSYLDGDPPETSLSSEVKRICEHIHTSVFGPDVPVAGYRELALAFVMYTNCPDNTLPIIWRQQNDWRALFPRASRYL